MLLPAAPRTDAGLGEEVAQEIRAERQPPQRAIPKRPEETFLLAVRDDRSFDHAVWHQFTALPALHRS
jgi:hypothetical protein